MDVTVGSLSCWTLLVPQELPPQRETYIKYDEEDNVNSIEKYKNPKQPPRSIGGKEKSEAATRMIKEELEFFPDATLCWYNPSNGPNNPS